MKIKIGNFDCTECWDGVFYKKLSAFPKITDWEIQTVLDFIAYEKLYGRECKIKASDEILSQIEQFKSQNKTRISAQAKITECTACPTYKGCMTDFVCHTSPVENAVKIEGKAEIADIVDCMYDREVYDYCFEILLSTVLNSLIILISTPFL